MMVRRRQDDPKPSRHRVRRRCQLRISKNVAYQSGADEPRRIAVNIARLPELLK
jgi:hypothetical protein